MNLVKLNVRIIPKKFRYLFSSPPPVSFFEKYVKMVSLNNNCRTHRAVSNDTKINKIRPDWTEIQTPEPLGRKTKKMKKYTNDTSFERKRRAESNNIKINEIGQDLTKFWHYLDLPESTTYVISLSNQVRFHWFWCHSTQLDELFWMSYHLYELQSLWFSAPVVRGSVFRSNHVGFCWFWCHSTQLDRFYNCCSDWPFLHIFRKNWLGGGELNKYQNFILGSVILKRKPSGFVPTYVYGSSFWIPPVIDLRILIPVWLNL